MLTLLASEHDLEDTPQRNSGASFGDSKAETLVVMESDQIQKQLGAAKAREVQ